MSRDASVAAVGVVAEALMQRLPLAWLGPAPRAEVEGALALALLVLAVAALALAFERFERAAPAPAFDRAVRGAAALAALALFARIAGQPARDLLALASSWDHLIFALLLGVPLRRAPPPLRIGMLAALSLLLVGRSVGWLALAGILGGCLAGWAAARWAPTRRASLQALLLAGILLWLWSLRERDSAASLHGVGLFVFVMLRHVSYVVEAHRGARASAVEYVCFLLFYPTCIGATEVFREFRQHNLGAAPPIDYRAGAVGLARGAGLAWLALHLTASEDAMTRSQGFVEMWQNLLLLYLRGACFAMGVWSLAEVGALFLGVRLRPNFRGVLRARNPSQFWRVWRGTMANWLITHVYIPLGGGRSHRTRNIAAVFAVSTVWHCVGIPFLRPQSFGWDDVAPIALWGLVNFAGVAGHAWLRRAWTPPQRSAPLRAAVVAFQWALTLCFGSLTVALLGFATAYVERFPHVLRTLAGLAG
jgi:hypothetical protein